MLTARQTLALQVALVALAGACAKDSPVHVEDKGYRFQASTLSCLNDQGQGGFNVGPMQCGQIEDSSDYKKAKLHGQDLRGLRIKNSQLTNADFSGADLTGAFFDQVNLNKADLSGANLANATIKTSATDFPAKNSQLSGIKINGNTYVHGRDDFTLMVALKDLDGEFDMEGVDPAHVDDAPRFDSKVDPQEKNMVLHDWASVSRFDLKQDKDSSFDKIFGGTDEAAVASYLKDRIHYVLPDLATTDSHLAALNFSRGIFLNALQDRMHRSTRESEGLAAGLQDGVEKTVHELPVPGSVNDEFVIDGEKPEVLSPRVGVLRVGPAYNFSLTVNRVAALVHEARHSDCYVGDGTDFKKSLIDDIQDLHDFRNQLRDRVSARRDHKGETASDSEVAEARGKSRNDSARVRDLLGKLSDAKTCGHAHVDCPSNSSVEYLRGLKAACEDMPWGAYAVGGLYSKAIVRDCTHCSETEKQVALMQATDSFSRVLVKGDQDSWPDPVTDMLTDEDFKNLRNGSSRK